MNIIECGEGLPQLTITTVSTCFNVGVHLNTEKIALTEKWLGAQLNKQKISGMIIRNKSSICQQTSALCFETGKVILSGASYGSMGCLCAWNLVLIFNKMGIPAVVNDFSINNNSAHFSLGYDINLAEAAMCFDCGCCYQKGYSGLRLKNIEGMGNIAIILYKNGKGIITGAKPKEHAIGAIRWLVPRIEQFKTKASEPSAADISIKKRKMLSDPRVMEAVVKMVNRTENTSHAMSEEDDRREDAMMTMSQGRDENIISAKSTKMDEESIPYVYVLPVVKALELSQKFSGDSPGYTPTPPLTSSKNKKTLASESVPSVKQPNTTKQIYNDTVHVQKKRGYVALESVKSSTPPRKRIKSTQ